MLEYELNKSLLQYPLALTQTQCSFEVRTMGPQVRIPLEPSESDRQQPYYNFSRLDASYKYICGNSFFPYV